MRAMPEVIDEFTNTFEHQAKSDEESINYDGFSGRTKAISQHTRDPQQR